MADAIAIIADHAPDELVEEAKASLAEPVDNARLGSAITRFLTRGQTQ